MELGCGAMVDPPTLVDHATQKLRLDLLRNRIHEYAVHSMDLRIVGGFAFVDTLYTAGCRSIAREQRQNEVVRTPIFWFSLGLYKCHPLDSLQTAGALTAQRANPPSSALHRPNAW